MHVSLEISPAGGLLLKQGPVILAELSQADSVRLGAALVAIAAGIMPIPTSAPPTTMLHTVKSAGDA